MIQFLHTNTLRFGQFIISDSIRQVLCGDNLSENNHGGDQIDGNEIVRRTNRRRRPSLLVLALLFSIALSSYSALRVSGAGQGFFGQQLFSVVAQYNFGAPGQSASSFTAGSTATVTLTVSDFAPGPNVLQIYYNATNPTEWNAASTNPGQGPITTNPLSMTYGSTVFAPSNFSGCASGNFACSVNVNVTHGSNTITVSLSASSTAQLETFSLSWFAQSVS